MDSSPSPWPEKETSFTGPSEMVFFWILLAIAVMGLSTFIGLFLFKVHRMQDGWIAFLVCGLITLFVVLFGSSLGHHVFWPQSIRHAAEDVLSDVPNEPLIEEGTYMHSKITHELDNSENSIVFMPILNIAQSRKNNVTRFCIVFLLVMLPISSCGLSFHMPLFIAVIATFVLMGLSIGGFLIMVYLITDQSLSRLTTLIVSHGGPFAELDVALPPSAPFFKTVRQLLNIPRDQIVAIQLCPYAYSIASENGPGVQGLLVQRTTDSAGYQRHVLLNCMDQIAGAKMMEQLASHLRVPFLFGADADGWKEEKKRAKNRPAPRTGGAG